MNRPVKRGKIRIFFGRIYFFCKKNFVWFFFSKRFARKIKIDNLKYQIFSHKTPLLRKLKDVDMWMQENKRKNLELAIRKINKIVIYPGQTFSFWRQVGCPSKKKGYLEGMVLDGGKVKAGIGGGLCQLTNLIYWLTLHTPLNVEERYRHSYDVFPDVNRNQPFGSGATCAYPNIDLQIKNNTNQKWQLVLWLENDFLNGAWFSDNDLDYSYKVYEKEHQIKSEIWGGYTRNNIIFRKIYNKENKEVGDEFVVANNAIMMYEPLLK